MTRIAVGAAVSVTFEAPIKYSDRLYWVRTPGSRLPWHYLANGSSLFEVAAIALSHDRVSIIWTSAIGYHKGRYYFATARHVAHRLNQSSRLGFVNPSGESRLFILGRLVENSERLVWRHHDQADVSLLKLKVSRRGIDEVADSAVSSDDLYLETPPRTSKLLVAGFPGGLGTRGGEISPITAVVHLASKEIHLGAKLEGMRVENAYLVIPPTGRGFSGAPIFYMDPEEEVKCTGMLNGAWSDPTGGKYSISAPARYLLDLVDEDQPDE